MPNRNVSHPGLRNGGSARSSSKWNGILFANQSLFVLNLFLYYIEVSLRADAGETNIFPNFGCFLVGCLLLVVNTRSVKVEFFYLWIAIFLFLLIQALVTSATFDDGFIYKRMRSVFQLGTALFSVYGVFLSAVELGRKRLSRIFCLIFLLIVVGSYIEISFQPVRDISDSFRNMVYQSSLLYESDGRDIALYGAIRPKFFGREPSLVGINAGFALSMWTLAEPRWSVPRRLVVLVVGTAAAMFVARSPTVTFFFCATLLGVIVSPEGRRWLPGAAVPAIVAVLSFLFLLPFAVNILNEMLNGELDPIVRGASYLARIIGPYSVAHNVIWEHPVFGVGIGAFEALTPYRDSAYMDLFDWQEFKRNFDDTSVQSTMSNAFWEYWMFFGLGGGIILIVALTRILRLLQVPAPATLFLALALAAQNLGGCVSYRLWFFMFCWAAVAHLAARERA